MSQEVVKRSPVAEVCTTIAGTDFKGKIAQAVPPGMAVERFTRTTLTAIQQNPEVVTADRQSLYNAVIRAAQDGLLPDGREAALVIFNTRDKGKQVQYMPMIGGLRKRAAEHGFAIDAFVVHENDVFDYELGFEPRVTHRPPRLGEDRGPVIGAYAVATRLSDGRKFLEPPMSVEEIEKVRAASRAKDRGPWVSWWEEMARKTVARRLFKSLPLIADETTGRVLEAADSEYEFGDRRMTVEEANVDASVGPVGPPPDDPGPDDSPIDAEFQEVSADDDPPEDPAPQPSGDQPARQEAATAEGAGDVPATDDPGQGSIFAQMAETAQTRQRAQRARQHRDPEA